MYKRQILDQETAEIDAEIVVQIADDAIIRTQQEIYRSRGESAQQIACQTASQEAARTWSRLGESGRYIRQAGDAIVEAECKEALVQFRSTGACWSHMPVQGHRLPWLDVATRVLVEKAAKVDCAEAWPTYVVCLLYTSPSPRD